MPSLYIADGHHRSAAAALVGQEKQQQNPNHKGDEEYNYFMAVCFQASQLTILDYNRVVKDLNGLSSEEFLQKLQKDFVVTDKGTDIYKPQQLHSSRSIWTSTGTASWPRRVHTTPMTPLECWM